MKTSIFFIMLLLSFGSTLFAAMAVADQDPDTKLRMQRRDERSARQTEQILLAVERNKAATAAAMIINRQASQVADTLDELGQALYLSIQSRQWLLAENFLNRYLAIPKYDPMLMHYAKGALARVAGNFMQAEQEYRSLLALQQAFLPGQLELARVLFENQKNNDALAYFQQIDVALPSDNPRVQGIRNTIESFIGAIKHRDAWQGSFSFGPSFNDNLNQSSGTFTCLARNESGVCLADRTTPDAVDGFGLDFNASLNKRVSLSGHHGLVFRSLAYGATYPGHSQFNEQTMIASLGYSFHDADDRLSLSPQLKYNTSGNEALYLSSGLKLDWLRNLSNQSAFKLEAEVEYQDFRPTELDYQSDWQWSLYASYWHQLSDNWLVFGGGDWTHKNNDEKVHAYQLVGANIGVNRAWEGLVDFSVFTALRERKYGDFNAHFQTRRIDKEQSYTLLLAFKHLSFYGITPTIMLQHKQVKSNVDWLYSYQQNKYSIKLEKRF
ncbi:MAG: DUF560 domain-containing protein [Gammaproteobacteria bacterium]|nr:DUF560 domain-containing protein [Gammaproteobacteria bacterium]